MNATDRLDGSQTTWVSAAASCSSRTFMHSVVCYFIYERVSCARPPWRMRGLADVLRWREASESLASATSLHATGPHIACGPVVLGFPKSAGCLCRAFEVLDLLQGQIDTLNWPSGTDTLPAVRPATPAEVQQVSRKGWDHRGNGHSRRRPRRAAGPRTVDRRRRARYPPSRS
jgi:hypothetical protein